MITHFFEEHGDQGTQWNKSFAAQRLPESAMWHHTVIRTEGCSPLQASHEQALQSLRTYES
jgi:hypothetical protein